MLNKVILTLGFVGLVASATLWFGAAVWYFMVYN